MSFYDGKFSYGPPRGLETMISLKVDNLTFRTTPDDLLPIFERYGRVGDIYIPRDRYSKESRGFAFVRYFDRLDAEDAMDRLDGFKVDGREIRVQVARYARPRDSLFYTGRSRVSSYHTSAIRKRRRSDSFSPARHRYRSRSRSYHKTRYRNRSRFSRSHSKSPSAHRSRENSRNLSRSSTRSRSSSTSTDSTIVKVSRPSPSFHSKTSKILHNNDLISNRLVTPNPVRSNSNIIDPGNTTDSSNGKSDNSPSHDPRKIDDSLSKREPISAKYATSLGNIPQSADS